MAGQAKILIDKIIEKVSNNNPVLKTTTRTKLILKGIQPDKYTPNTPDDPEVLKKIRLIGSEFGVTL